MLPIIFMPEVVLPPFSYEEEQVTKDNYNDNTNEKKILLKETYRLGILRGHVDYEVTFWNGSLLDLYTAIVARSYHPLEYSDRLSVNQC